MPRLTLWNPENKPTYIWIYIMPRLKLSTRRVMSDSPQIMIERIKLNDNTGINIHIYMASRLCEWLTGNIRINIHIYMASRLCEWLTGNTRINIRVVMSRLCEWLTGNTGDYNFNHVTDQQMGRTWLTVNNPGTIKTTRCSAYLTHVAFRLAWEQKEQITVSKDTTHKCKPMPRRKGRCKMPRRKGRCKMYNYHHKWNIQFYVDIPG